MLGKYRKSGPALVVVTVKSRWVALVLSASTAVALW